MDKSTVWNRAIGSFPKKQHRNRWRFLVSTRLRGNAVFFYLKAEKRVFWSGAVSRVTIQNIPNIKYSALWVVWTVPYGEFIIKWMD